jgi:peptide/nickel transport system ATP-binding protein
MTAPTADAMVRAVDLDVRFQSRRGTAHAVKGVSFAVEPGGALGIVGESGCGKSTVLRSLAGLEQRWTGRIELAGHPVGPRRRRDELARVQMVFQDPYGSLHPRHSIGRALAEPLIAMGLPDPWDHVPGALARVGLPARFAERYPHQLSGGQRQRVAIARALALRPPIVLLDEPTSALDVSIQAEILNLLMALREEHRLTYVFVSHDLAVVGQMCDRVLVMKDGAVVEELAADALRARSVEAPYTRELIANSFL